MSIKLVSYVRTYELSKTWQHIYIFLSTDGMPVYIDEGIFLKILENLLLVFCRTVHVLLNPIV
jgi:hypothetical protein